MAVPLILAFAGLLAGRELAVTKKRERSERSDRLGVNSLLGAGRNEFGRTDEFAYGPPTPAGTTAHTDLNPNQVEYIKALAINNPAAAREEAKTLIAGNQQQDNFRVTAEQNQARIDQQRDTFNLNQDIFDQGVTEFEFGKNVSQQELERANAAMWNVELGMQEAARNNSTTYGISTVDPQTGQVVTELGHMPGSVRFEENQKAIKDGTRLLNHMNQARGDLLEFQQSGDPGVLQTREMQSRLSAIWLILKDQQSLGVLSGSDLDLLVSQAPDGTAFAERVLSDPAALEAAMAVTSRGVEQQLGFDLNTQKNWGGTNNLANRRAVANIQGAELLNQATEGRIRFEQQAPARAARAASGQEARVQALSKQFGVPAGIVRGVSETQDTVGALLSEGARNAINSPGGLVGAAAGAFGLSRFLK